MLKDYGFLLIFSSLRHWFFMNQTFVFYCVDVSQHTQQRDFETSNYCVKISIVCPFCNVDREKPNPMHLRITPGNYSYWTELEPDEFRYRTS